ncbi:MAG: transposase [Gemmatales bacterium]|nr:transposase [Gemmatales bacterium]MDW8174452.1 transposase [Gemmatales bacterium]MDW8222804.1 transposase [Gemmatales bacterium]
MPLPAARFSPWDGGLAASPAWMQASVSEPIAQDLRALVRLASERQAQPSAVIWTRRTGPATPKGRARAGYDGHKKKRGWKIHAAVDPRGHLLAVLATPANEPERASVEALAEKVHELTGQHVEVAYVAGGYHGTEPAEQARGKGIRRALVKHREAQRGFV